MEGWNPNHWTTEASFFLIFEILISTQTAAHELKKAVYTPGSLSQLGLLQCHVADWVLEKKSTSAFNLEHFNLSMKRYRLIHFSRLNIGI
jgi:hypothetical protein